MPSKLPSPPVIRVPPPQSAVPGSLAYPAPAAAPAPRSIVAPAPSPLSAIAEALCMPPDELAREMALLVTAAAYLRLLRDKDPAAWRERILAILGATGGNFSQAARRIGITYRGLLKTIQEDAELQRQVSERWPERHERGLVR